MWWKKDDIEFYKKVIKKYNVENVLELCCGTGRIGLPLIDSNINYSGIDISQNYIDFFNSKLGAAVPISRFAPNKKTFKSKSGNIFLIINACAKI